MRRIDKLLFRAIAPPFAVTLAVLTFVVSAHEFGTLSELLITKNASLGVMLAIAGSIFPDILIYSLPLSFLIGVLVGLGGLSGESQILALRACGLPLKSLLRFILGFGTTVGILTALLSLVAAPHANDFRRQLVERVSVSVVTTQIQARVFNENFRNSGIVFYIKDLSDDKQSLSGVFLSDGSDPGIPRIVLAREASWVRDPENRRIQLHLENGASYSAIADEPERENQSFFQSTDIPMGIRRSNDPPARDVAPDSVAETPPRKPREQKSSDLWRNRTNGNPDENIKLIVELNRRIALPLSIIPFSFLGLALAVSAPKSGRSFGFGMGLVTVVIFYALFANGIRLAYVEKISPWLGPWMANVLLIVAGCFLLTKAEKRFSLAHWMAQLSWEKISGWRVFLRHGRPSTSARTSERYSSSIRPTGGLLSKIFRVCPTRIMDFYILRGFLNYFLWSLAACTVLFLLLTIFELLDDIIRNSIALISVADYLIFLIPQILIVAIPMSILLAALVNLGLLEKNSEITAVKASGWSLYRLAVPIILAAVTLSFGLYLMQDYILPYANDRQDSLRNHIQNKPARTSRQMERKWILGDSGRIYNYEYFDSMNSFINLNAYEVDFEQSRLRQRIYAERARIGDDGTWVLENGWRRDYRTEAGEFEQFREKSMRLPERASYFRREIFQPKESSKLTYFELYQYINSLQKSGYNAVELQVELHKKIAFPVSCLIMALVGIPFAFSVGRKGAFFGIGVSIAIAVIYWGVSGVFESMGAYGLLLPLLAAWAPNILFAAAGLTLFLSIRT